MTRRTYVLPLVLFGLLLGCSSSGEDPTQPQSVPGQAPRDQSPDGLYADFLDGKFDGDGHPLDAQVWEAEDGCGAETGVEEHEGLGLHAGDHVKGAVCAATSTALGRGRFIINVRALVTEPQDPSEGCFCDEDAPVLTIRALDEAGVEVAQTQVLRSAFETPNVYRNVQLHVTNQTQGPIRFEVSWEGGVSTRIDYVELFRARRAVAVEPVSGVVGDDESFRVEMSDPPEYASLRVSCNGEDRTEVLDALLDSGEAMRVDTDFRASYTIPVGAMLEGCARPSRVMFQMVTDDWARATSRITVYDQMPPCTFEPGTTRVLLTGFEPFPADSTRDNSSEHAVSGVDTAAFEGVSIMPMILPVEFSTAAALLAHTITACEPDVVVGFGQGRTAVDLERMSYNWKDSATFSGGFPDNRGFVAEGVPILGGGPEELPSGLPLESILMNLEADGIDVGYSDDPGRYVCNNLFYRLMFEVQGTSRIAGFVHLPRIPVVDETSAAMLRTVTTRVIEASVQAYRSGQ